MDFDNRFLITKRDTALFFLRHLYAIARNVQKHHRLLAVMESLDNGKSVRETRDCDVPLVARHFYHHAGWAQLADTEMRDWKPVGVYTFDKRSPRPKED